MTEALRRRLNEVGKRARSSDNERSARSEREILEERARDLAKKPTEEKVDGSRDVIVFTVGVERYALDMRFVHEVVKVTELTALPDTPPYIAGIANVRGEIVLVIDLRQDSEPDDADPAQRRLLVCGRRDSELAIITTEIDDMSKIDESDLQSLPPRVEQSTQLPLLGVTSQAVMVLDGAALLDDPRFVVDQMSE